MLPNLQSPGFFSRISVRQNHRQSLRSPDPTSSFSSNRQSSRLAPLESSGPLIARIFTSIDTHTAISSFRSPEFQAPALTSVPGITQIVDGLYIARILKSHSHKRIAGKEKRAAGAPKKYGFLGGLRENYYFEGRGPAEGGSPGVGGWSADPGNLRTRIAEFWQLKTYGLVRLRQTYVPVRR